MNSSQRIIKNSLILLSSHIFTKLINLALVLVLTRMLGASGFGIYNFSLAFVALFMVIGNLGINSLLTRDVARDKSRINSFLGHSIPLLILLSGLAFLVINISVSFIAWDQASKTAIRIFSVYLVFDNFSRHFISVFRAFEKMEYEAYTNLIERIAMLLTAVLLWQFNQSLFLLLWIFASIEFIKAGTAFIFMRRFFKKVEWKWFGPQTVSLIRQSFPFALMAVFGTVSGRIDTVMLKIFHTDLLVGFYNAAHKLIESLIFIPENLNLVLFPAFAVLFFQNRIQFQKTFDRTFLFLSVLAFPISAGLFILAPQIIHLLFQPEYSPASIALQWLGLALGLVFFKFLFATTLNAIGKQHIFAGIAAASMVVNVVFNYLFIPKLGLFGASFATVLSEATAVIFTYIFVQRAINHSPSLAVIFKPLLATAVMCLGILWIRNLNIFILMAIAVVIYSAMILLLKTFSKQDLRYFIELFRKKFGQRRKTEKKEN